MIRMMYNQILRREISRQRPVLPFSLRLADSVAASFSSSQSGDQEVRNTAPAAQPSQPTSLEDNPYYAKYQTKIERVKKSGSISDAASSKADVIQDPVAIAMKQMAERYTDSEKEAQTPIEAISSSRRTSLSDIVKLEMMASLPVDEVRDVWMRHHRDKEHCIYAVLEASEYEKQLDIATQYPVFLFPLPKTSLPDSNDGQGYQLFLSRFKDHSFFLTPLAEYQRHGESAVPTLVINHFPELAHEKHIVLMNGTYDPASLNALEVQCLANEIKLFYSGSDKRKLLLLHTMNKEPERFNYMDVIKEIESC